MNEVESDHSGGTRALSGIRIVETQGLLTAYCGKLLASLGAEVFKIEPPGGDPTRTLLTDTEHGKVRTGAAYWYNNLGKRVVLCDPEDPEGAARLQMMLSSADVLLTSYQPQVLASLNLSPDRLAESHPGLIVTAITPFGLTGPYRDCLATDTTMLASGGQLYLTGYPDRRPLRYGGLQAYKEGSIHGAYGTLIALFERMISDRGQVVDVSVQECVANSLQTTMQLYDLTGEIRLRVGSRLAECADGYVRNMGIARGWQALMEWLDEDGEVHNLADLVAEMSPSERPSTDLTARIDAALQPLFARKTKRAIFEQALRRRIALAPVNAADEILAMPELEERSFWATVTDSDTGQLVRVPRGPFSIEPAGLVHPREAMPADVSELLAPRAIASSPTFDSSPSTPPLQGVLVIDFTWFGAGAMGTRVLAHFGATVIKLESSQRIDGIRLAPPFRGDPGVNKSGFFNNFNSGKKSITLDMHSRGGVDVAERLIRIADVVADNFSPGVLSAFGISDTRIHELNPRAVILHMPMGGTSGELRKAVGFGATIEAVSGLVHLMGDPDRPPVGTEVNYPDYGSNPYHAASALVAGLIAVRKTGRGQVIELAQVESTISFIGEALVEAQRTGLAPGRQGNVTPECLFNEVLRCAGDDEWCTVSCLDAEQLSRLLELADVPLRTLEDFKPIGTAENHRALAELLSGWSRDHDKYMLMEILQEAGLASAVVANSRDLLERDPQMESRKHYVVLDHPEAGRVTFDGPSVRLSRTPGGVSSPAPCLGEHTDSVLRELLGMSPTEVASLMEAGALV